jgi:hypothetical protein
MHRPYRQQSSRRAADSRRWRAGGRSSPGIPYHGATSPTFRLEFLQAQGQPLGPSPCEGRGPELKNPKQEDLAKSNIPSGSEDGRATLGTIWAFASTPGQQLSHQPRAGAWETGQQASGIALGGTLYSLVSYAVFLPVFRGPDLKFRRLVLARAPGHRLLRFLAARSQVASCLGLLPHRFSCSGPTSASLVVALSKQMLLTGARMSWIPPGEGLNRESHSAPLVAHGFSKAPRQPWQPCQSAALGTRLVKPGRATKGFIFYIAPQRSSQLRRRPLPLEKPRNA